MAIASRKTISAKLGYDFDVEQEQIDHERSLLPPAEGETSRSQDITTSQ